MNISKIRLFAIVIPSLFLLPGAALAATPWLDTEGINTISNGQSGFPVSYVFNNPGLYSGAVIPGAAPQEISYVVAHLSSVNGQQTSSGTGHYSYQLNGSETDCVSPEYTWSNVGTNTLGVLYDDGTNNESLLSEVIIPFAGSACTISSFPSGNNGFIHFINDTGSVSTPIGHRESQGFEQVAIYNSANNPGVAPDTSTRIVDLTPHEGDVTGNATTISLHVFINPVDLVPGSSFGISLSLNNLDQNTVFSAAFGKILILLNDVTATSSGDFFYSTTTTLADGGYSVTGRIQGTSVFGLINNPFSSLNQEQSHHYAVNHETAISILNNGLTTQFNNIFSSTTATTSLASGLACNVIGGSFDIPNCLVFLFVPDFGFWGQQLLDTKDSVLNRYPWGYIQRLASIVSSTTPVEPISMSYTFGSSSPEVLQGRNFSINVFDNMTMLNSIHSDTSGDNIWDIVDPYFTVVVAFAVLLVVLDDIMGMRIGTDFTSGSSESETTTVTTPEVVPGRGGRGQPSGVVNRITYKKRK